MKTVLHRGAWAESEPMVYTACNGNCNQGRQCDCVADIPQMWDVEKELFASLNKWVRTVGLRTLGLVAVGLTVLAVLAGMVRVAGWA